LRALPRPFAASDVVLSFIFRLCAIAVCGGSGALLAWLLINSLGWTGVGGAITGVITGTALATLFWVGGIALIRALNLDR
jgi:hypothetical protein